jgi:hypothetical protein
MTIRIDLSGLRETRWHEYAIRFVFGGLITSATGLIGHLYGPQTAGLFLAFPAIFPATATLVEKHEAQKKNRAGLEGVSRGRQAAALDAAGAALGSIGLIAFSIVVWRLLVYRHSPVIVLGGATLLWLGVSGLGWRTGRSQLCRWGNDSSAGQHR